MDFYPFPARLPIELRLEGMLIRPLQASDNELDYAAVMASAEYLRKGNSDWPREDFTPEENLADLQIHELDHTARANFTFTILDPTQDRCLGCIYVNPLDRWLQQYPPAAPHPIPAGCAAVDFWMRPDCQQQGLDLLLLHALIQWFAGEWDFPRVVFIANQLEIHQRELYTQAGLMPIFTLESPNRLTMYG